MKVLKTYILWNRALQCSRLCSTLSTLPCSDQLKLMDYVNM